MKQRVYIDTSVVGGYFDMETIKKEKKFDCIQMKNDIQAKIYAEIKDMNAEELLAYFNKTTAWDKPKKRALTTNK
jgi:hypothetical protein